MNEEQIVLVSVLTVVFVLLSVMGIYLLFCRRSKLSVSLKKNRPIMVKMFNGNISMRRNAVTEETCQTRNVADVETPITPIEATEKVFTLESTENGFISSKHLSKSLPDLEMNKILPPDNNMNETKLCVEEKKKSVILDPLDLMVDDKCYEKTLRSHQYLPPTLQQSSLPEKTTEFDVEDCRSNTIQSPQNYIRYLREKNDSVHLQNTNRLSKFSSLNNLHTKHLKQIPRAMSIERIPIDNARKFKDCRLTEISPGCFLVPIQDCKRKAHNEEMKVYYK